MRLITAWLHCLVATICIHAGHLAFNWAPQVVYMRPHAKSTRYSIFHVPSMWPAPCLNCRM